MGKAQDLPAGPVGVSGRMLTPFGEDRYRVPVTPGKKLRLEVFAEPCRLTAGHGPGRPQRRAGRLEPGFALRTVRGRSIPSWNTPCPTWCPASLSASSIPQGRGGPRAVYRLTVTPRRQTIKSGFQLHTVVQRANSPPDGWTNGRSRAARPGRLRRPGCGACRRRICRLARAWKGPTFRKEQMVPSSPFERGGAGRRRSDYAAAARVAACGLAREHAVTIKGHALERLQPWLATEIALGRHLRPGRGLPD